MCENAKQLYILCKEDTSLKTRGGGSRRKNNIKIHYEIECEGVGLDHDWTARGDLADTVVGLRVPRKTENALTSRQLTSQDVLCSWNFLFRQQPKFWMVQVVIFFA